MRAKLSTLGLEFHSAALADGTPRLMGSSKDDLTKVELIGRSNQLESISLWLPMDDKGAVVEARNKSAIAIITAQTGWRDGDKWVADTIARGDALIVHDGAKYEVKSVAAMGVRFLNVDPA